MDNNITTIDIKTFNGSIPTGKDLVVFEKNNPASALVLYGFDEVGMFDHQFKNPIYGFAQSA